MSTTTNGLRRWIRMDASMNGVASENLSLEPVGHSSLNCFLVFTLTAKPEKALHTAFSRSPWHLILTSGNFCLRQEGFRWTEAALHVTSRSRLTDTKQF